MDKKSLQFILTIIAILASTVALFLYAKGYSFDRQKGSLGKTGMIMIKSQPDGAKIYLDEKFVEVSNANLTNLKGGLYNIRLEKEGYGSFQKDLPVKEEFATFLDAVLIPLNPELKPLTPSGVKDPTLTESRDKILFLTKDRDRPGIWSLNLTGNIFSLIKGALEVVAKDNDKASYSLAENLYLAPNDEEVLVKMNKKGYYLLALTQGEPTPQATTSAQSVFTGWQKIDSQKKLTLSQKYKVPKNLFKTATESASLWSPDERRFIYALSQGKILEYHVYSTTDPLGVGEKEDANVINLEKTQKTKVSWFSDSKHLLITTCEQETKDEICLSGKVQMVRIDGTNLTQVYSGALSSINVFPTPDGTKIIIQTSFNQNTQPNLYAIILR